MTCGSVDKAQLPLKLAFDPRDRVSKHLCNVLDQGTLADVPHRVGVNRVSKEGQDAFPGRSSLR